MARTDRRIALLLEVLDQAFGRAAWHGPNLAGSLRGLTWREALKRPRAGRHCIWELVLHTAYWKCIARKRLTRDPGLEFPRAPANFPVVPRKPTAALWRQDVVLLRKEHRLLRGSSPVFLRPAWDGGPGIPAGPTSKRFTGSRPTTSTTRGRFSSSRL